MSKQKQTKTETQRFSGPELSELLDQVAREHGSDAAIAAVNKIRSGGVAGFFCREEFEVVVKNTAAQAATTKRKTAKTEASAASPETTTEQPPAQPRVAQAQSSEPTQQMAPVEEIDLDERIQPTGLTSAVDNDPLRVLLNSDRSMSAAVAEQTAAEHAPDGANEVFGGPRPNETNWTDARFRALVDRRLEEASSTEALHAERQARRPIPAQEIRPPIIEQPNLQPVVPAPGLSVPIHQASGIGVLTPQSDPLSSFWLRLQRAQHELASFMPLASAIVATIGPLSLTTPIVRRLRAQAGFESADVIVLTDRAEIVSEPSWELVRSGHQLLDAVREKTDWPTLLLIDVPVELPNWVAPLENRLRMAGVGLFRYAVPGNPTSEQLDQYRLGSDVPYVLDLVSRVEPERLVEFIALRHPITSVAGADLNAELLVAMREQVGVGP